MLASDWIYNYFLGIDFKFLKDKDFIILYSVNFE